MHGRWARPARRPNIAHHCSSGQHSKAKATHCNVYSVSEASVILCSLALSVFGVANAYARVSICSHTSPQLPACDRGQHSAGVGCQNTHRLRVGLERDGLDGVHRVPPTLDQSLSGPPCELSPPSTPHTTLHSLRNKAPSPLFHSSQCRCLQTGYEWSSPASQDGAEWYWETGEHGGTRTLVGVSGMVPSGATVTASFSH